MTVADLDEGKSSDLGALGRRPSSPAPITSRWAHHQPSSGVGAYPRHATKEVASVDAIAGLCGGLIFVHCLIFIKAIHIKLQLVLIAYTAQNWSSRLLFPSAWNNFTAIRSTVVMLNSNTVFCSVPLTISAHTHTNVRQPGLTQPAGNVPENCLPW